jgi:hypothetical protein
MDDSGRSADERANDKRLVEGLLAGVAVTLTSERSEVTVHAGAGGVVTGIELTDRALRLEQGELGVLLTRMVKDTVRHALAVESEGVLALAREPAAAAGTEPPPMPAIALDGGEDGGGPARDEEDRRALAAFAEAALSPPTILCSPGGEVEVVVGMTGDVLRIRVGDTGMTTPPRRLAAVLHHTLRQTADWATMVRTDRIQEAAQRRDAEERAALAEQEAERRFRQS